MALATSEGRFLLHFHLTVARLKNAKRCCKPGLFPRHELKLAAFHMNAAFWRIDDEFID